MGKPSPRVLNEEFRQIRCGHIRLAFQKAQQKQNLAAVQGNNINQPGNDVVCAARSKQD